MNLTGSDAEDDYNNGHYAQDMRDVNQYNMQNYTSMAGNMGQ
jgi:hypothetical protein